jgi:membrane protein
VSGSRILRQLGRALRRFGILLAMTIDKCARDNTPFLAAAISFYTMLSMAPGLWIAVAAAGAFVGRQSARDAALDWVLHKIGPSGANYLGIIIDQANQSSRFATIGGAIAVFLAATAAFAGLQNSLARIWNLPAQPGDGLISDLRNFTKNFLTTRVLAFVVMVLLGVLLVASLFLGAALSFVESYLPARLPAPKLLLETADFSISYLLMLLLFGFIYLLLHRRRFHLGEIWVGAAVTAFLFAIGNAFIGPYLGGAGLRSAYGAAGAFVLVLLWVYYSTQVFLFGAAFTEVYARHHRHSGEARTPPRG